MNLYMNYTSWSYLFFIFITIFLLHRLFSSSSRSGLPPGPQGLPILGHMHLLRSSLPRSLQALAHTYGPLMSIRIGSLRVLVVSDSDTAKQILKTHDPDFASKFVFGPRQFNVYKGAEFFNAPYGPYWRFMKKLCMTKLFAGYQLDRFVDIREEETLALLSSLVERSRNGEACDLSLEFTALTTKILSKMVMGKRCRQNSNIPVEIRKIVSDIMACATRFGFMELFGPLRDLDLFGNGKKLRSSIWQYDELVEKILKEYEKDRSNDEEEKDKDIVDILLDTYKDPKAELKLTMNQIKFFILVSYFHYFSLASLELASIRIFGTTTTFAGVVHGELRYDFCSFTMDNDGANQPSGYLREDQSRDQIGCRNIESFNQRIRFAEASLPTSSYQGNIETSSSRTITTQRKQRRHDDQRVRCKIRDKDLHQCLRDNARSDHIQRP